MKTEIVLISSIHPYARNPRKNEKAVAAVAASIKEFGWQQPIVVDKNKVIVVGHTRYLAAMQLGLNNVPVVVADQLTAEQVKAYRIIDNRSNEVSEWDMDLLKLELDEIDLDFGQFHIEQFEFPEDNISLEEDQPRLDQLEPKFVTCPSCEHTFDINNEK